jgi:hypothetical protein
MVLVYMPLTLYSILLIIAPLVVDLWPVVLPGSQCLLLGEKLASCLHVYAVMLKSYISIQFNIFSIQIVQIYQRHCESCESSRIVCDSRFVSRFTIQNFILLNVNNENEIYLSCTKFLPPHTKAFFIIFILLIANSTPPSNEERAGSIKK